MGALMYAAFGISLLAIGVGALPVRRPAASALRLLGLAVGALSVGSRTALITPGSRGTLRGRTGKRTAIIARTALAASVVGPVSAFGRAAGTVPGLAASGLRAIAALLPRRPRRFRRPGRRSFVGRGGARLGASIGRLGRLAPLAPPLGAALLAVGLTVVRLCFVLGRGALLRLRGNLRPRLRGRGGWRIAVIEERALGGVLFGASLGRAFFAPAE